MWSSFFAAGGWPMIPTALFGFLLLAASVLYALRSDPRWARATTALGAVTLAMGVAGSVIGICMSLHYLPQVEPPRQLGILALGVEESLHGTLMALLCVAVAGVIAAAGHLRARA